MQTTRRSTSASPASGLIPRHSLGNPFAHPRGHSLVLTQSPYSLLAQRRGVITQPFGRQMKTTTILETLLVAAALAAPHAKAAPISLQGATVTATYNGQADGMLGLDHGYNAEAGSNTTALDPTDTSVEFLTSDMLFGFDFSNTGMLTVYSNGTPMPVGSYGMVFDFGSSLPQSITSFTLDDTGAIGGVPKLSVLDGHTIGLDLSSVTWISDYASFTAQIGSSAPAGVPEPGSIALVLAGMAGVAAVRRRAHRA